MQSSGRRGQDRLDGLPLVGHDVLCLLKMDVHFRNDGRYLVGEESTQSINPLVSSVGIAPKDELALPESALQLSDQLRFQLFVKIPPLLADDIRDLLALGRVGLVTRDHPFQPYDAVEQPLNLAGGSRQPVESVRRRQTLRLQVIG